MLFLSRVHEVKVIIGYFWLVFLQEATHESVPEHGKLPVSDDAFEASKNHFLIENLYCIHANLAPVWEVYDSDEEVAHRSLPYRQPSHSEARKL